MPPHIYASTYIFCYLCIHYSKGNVSRFTCIKLYKLEAWPDFVSSPGPRAALCNQQPGGMTAVLPSCWFNGGFWKSTIKVIPNSALGAVVVSF